jgi:hypothetical protein
LIGLFETDFADTAVDGTRSLDDTRFQKIVGEGVRQLEDGHVEMPLPLKKSPAELDGRALAEGRLKRLSSRLERDKDLHADYTTFVENIIEKGYAEYAPKESTQPRNYIPHHAVRHPRKGKVRVVFDCSAGSPKSLNDYLLKGPNLNNSLPGILLHFREETIAFSCDVEQMFYQFKVPEEQRDMLRFLWWQGGDLQRTPDEFRMTVHLFGAASSQACASYGLRFLANAHQADKPDGARFILSNFYVDDGLTCAATEDQALKIALEAREICSFGGMNLHKFVSNSAALTSAFCNDATSSTRDLKNGTAAAVPNVRLAGGRTFSSSRRSSQ